MTGTKKDIMELHQSYPKLTPMPWGKRWTLQPKVEWVEEVTDACGRAGISLFLKDNLEPILPEESPYYEVIDEDPMLTPRLRQKLPNG
ncbi:hypothetical protein ES703_79265 [subsurface metagenome]